MSASRGDEKPPLDPQAMKRALQRIEEQLEQSRQSAKALQAREKEYDELRGVLEGLPEKISHEVMVPYGPLAFFEGHLHSTNEVLVQSSSEWFALRTTKNAIKCLDKRKEKIRDDLRDVEKETEEIEGRRIVAGGAAGEGTARTVVHEDGTKGIVSLDKDGFMDIREELPPEIGVSGRTEASLKEEDTVAANSDDDAAKTLAKLRELERLEELEELEALDELMAGYERSGELGTCRAGQGFVAPSVPAGQPEVRSPADLYKLMGGTEARPASVPQQAPLLPPDAGNSPTLAFTGTVQECATSVKSCPSISSAQVSLERQAPVVSQDTLQQPAAAAKPRVSKFKAERQQMR